MTGTLSEKVTLMTTRFIQYADWLKNHLVVNRDEGLYVNQNVFHAFVSGTGGVHGSGGSGHIPTTDLGSTLNVYQHFKLPYTSADDVEFGIEIQGYNYGPSKSIFCTIALRIVDGVLSGFLGDNNTHPCGAYISASGDVMVWIKYDNIYYTTISISAWCADESMKILNGQIQGRVSLSATMDF